MGLLPKDVKDKLNLRVGRRPLDEANQPVAIDKLDWQMRGLWWSTYHMGKMYVIIDTISDGLVICERVNAAMGLGANLKAVPNGKIGD